MKSQFGLFMRQNRQAAGHTVLTLAHAIGCDPATIEAVESNLRPPPGQFLVAWANELRLTVEAIVLCFVNQQARKMCLEAGITPLFKVVPADWGEEYGMVSKMVADQVSSGYRR
jgi:transcriptional regulator with XRE-family HTH domain